MTPDYHGRRRLPSTVRGPGTRTPDMGTGWTRNELQTGFHRPGAIPPGPPVGPRRTPPARPTAGSRAGPAGRGRAGPGPRWAEGPGNQSRHPAGRIQGRFLRAVARTGQGPRCGSGPTASRGLQSALGRPPTRMPRKDTRKGGAVHFTGPCSLVSSAKVVSPSRHGMFRTSLGNAWHACR